MTEATLPDRDVPPSPSPAATASLLCGLAGAFVLPAFVAIGVGAVVLRRGDQGNPTTRRLARLGIVCAVVWLCADTAACVWFYRNGARAIANHFRPQTVALINALPQGKFDGRIIRIGPGEAKVLADDVAGMGRCRDVTIRYAEFSHGDEPFGIVFFGTAEFEQGRRRVRGRMFFDGVNWGYSELDWQ